MHIELSTPVSASTEVLWSVVGDVVSWPRILDSIDAVHVTSDGEFGEGSTARVKQPGMPMLTWTVTRWVPGAGFDWKAASPGLATIGRHWIEPSGASAQLRIELEQTGVLAPAVGLLSGRRTRRFVRLELAGLKHAAERRT